MNCPKRNASHQNALLLPKANSQSKTKLTPTAYMEYAMTKKMWCFNAKILLRTSSRGRMCWKGNSGPVGCFFVIAYSMYAVEVSFVLPKRQQYQVNNQIFSTTNRGSEPVNPKNISENIPSHEGGQMGCYCYILTFTPLSHNGWEELSNTTTSTLNKAFCFNFK